MSDDFEDLLKRWLRDRAGNDRSALQALAGNVAALPPRRPNRTRPLAVAASIIVLLGLLAFALPRFSGVGTEATSTPTQKSDAPRRPGRLRRGPSPGRLHDRASDRHGVRVRDDPRARLPTSLSRDAAVAGAGRGRRCAGRRLPRGVRTCLRWCPWRRASDTSRGPPDGLRRRRDRAVRVRRRRHRRDDDSGDAERDRGPRRNPAPGSGLGPQPRRAAGL